MIDTWNPAKLNEKISGRDSWNPAILNEAVTDRDSWNPAILNESAGDTPVEFEATIIVTYPSGATVTCSDGTTTLTADENPMAFSIPNTGTWTVTSVLNGVTKTSSVIITTNGQEETVTIPFEAYITVTYPSGSSVTLSDGTTTYTATESPYTFTVNDEGTWTLNRSVGGDAVYTTTVVITTYGQSESIAIPELLTFKGIQNVLDNHRETTLLNVGDEVDIIITDGGNDVTWTLQIADINIYESHEVMFTSKNLYTRSNYSNTNNVPYGDNSCTLRLNCEAFYNSINSSDREYIKNWTKSPSDYNGVHEYTGKVFPPMVVELGGTKTAAYTVTPKPFAIFNTAANRIKQSQGEDWSYWTMELYNTDPDGMLIDSINTSGSYAYLRYNNSQIGTLPCFHLIANS